MADPHQIPVATEGVEEATARPVESVESTAPAPPPAPAPAEPSESFFARLATAWKGFWLGWHGELLEIPEGEEGTVPLAQLRAVERKLEKKLGKSETAATVLREEVAGLQKQVAERDVELRDAQRELKRVRATSEESEQALRADLSKVQERLAQREAALVRLETDLAEAQKGIASREESLAAAQQREASLRQQTDAATAQLRADLAAREATLAELRAQMEQAASASATILAGLKKELDKVRENLIEKDTANDMLLTEVSDHESQADHAKEDAQRAQAELKEEMERLEAQLKASEQAKDKLRSELIAALPEKVAAADLRLKVSAGEKDYARKVEEAELLRTDVRELRRRLAENESKMGGLEETEGKRASLQREYQRQSAQLDAVRDQLETARLQAEKLRAAVQEFHGPAVSAVQVAGVYAETVAGSLALSESDRADIVEIKQNMDALRGALQKLAAKLAEGDAARST